VAASMSATITIGIDPTIRIGPLALEWHGLTIAIGIVCGGIVAARWARERGLEPDPIYTFGVLAALGGLVGGRLFYVLEHGGPLLDDRGFTFDGGVILAALLIAGYVKRSGVSAVINGEHYGPRSDFFLAVRNSHPDALTPNPAFAYHNGGLYEVLLAAVILTIMWSLRDRLRRAGELAWLVLGLFAAGRFFVFFVRSDSPQLALGLDNTQWTSLGMLVLVLVGWALTTRRMDPRARADTTSGA